LREDANATRINMDILAFRRVRTYATIATDLDIHHRPKNQIAAGRGKMEKKTVLSESVVLTTESEEEDSLLKPKKSSAVKDYLGLAMGPLALAMAALPEFHSPPSKNIPCHTCGKPTRSHFDKKTGKCQCHECYLKNH